MAVVAMKQLLEAGVHFGHQTRRWDPRMAEYIFQARNGIHIIDLQKTSKKLDEAYAFIKEQAEEGKTVLFVGTKKQAQECVKEAALKCGMYYVDQRWLGGMLTNFDTIQKRIQRLKDLETMSEDSQLGGMLTCDFHKDGSAWKIENVCLTPLMNHYETTNQKNIIDTREKFTVYRLKDYTDELAKKHALQGYNGITISKERMQEKVKERVGSHIQIDM